MPQSCSTNLKNEAQKQESMPRAKQSETSLQELIIELDKEQIEHLSTLENPSMWVRRAIDEKLRREKTVTRHEEEP